MKHINIYIALLLLTVFSACADSEYSNYRCHLVINNNIIKDNTLASAMNENSTGVFCRISLDGTRQYKFESNQGGTPTYGTLTAIDQNAKWAIGVYNGIIVGFSNIDHTFMAYDNQCRNCYESSGLTRYALTMNTNGTATCKNCRRIYDMNNNGNIINGDNGKGLIRYRASTTGPLGVLSVNN